MTERMLQAVLIGIMVFWSGYGLLAAWHGDLLYAMVSAAWAGGAMLLCTVLE